MKTLFIVLGLVLHVAQGEKINDALQQAREAYQLRGETSTLLIEPGTYYEELTIDIPNLTLRNAAKRAPSAAQIAVRDGGVHAGKKAVRISWYCGHGYQYRSMGDRPNYGGQRERRWNASVLVTAPGFKAEGIIFENSFNLYVSEAELRDSLTDISQSGLNWTEKERPKRQMPERPRVLNSTEVQQRYYRERASALSLTREAQDCQLINCRVVGRQDALYGDHGASLRCDHCILGGAVDYIFGGMDLTVTNSQLVAMIGQEKGDKCYIAAGRGYAPKSTPTQEAALDSIPKEEYARQGMLFRDCVVRFATEDELVAPGNTPVWLCRPWRWWGTHHFENIQAAKGVLRDEKISLGLTKGHPVPFVYIH